MPTENPEIGFNLTTTINNVNICYDDVGEGRIPVIFLHGFLFDKSMWHIQFDHLLSSYRMIAPDIRGFGKSKDEETILSIDLLTDDLIRFMDSLSIDKAVICGLSMGGYIVQNAVKRYPDRFVAIILCDTNCIADSTIRKNKRYEQIENIKKEGAVGFYSEFIKNVFSRESLKTKKELVKHLRSIVYANTPQIACNGLSALAERSETCSMLEEIKIPTLIICGKEDEVTPLAQSEYMHEQIKGSLLKVIEQAGHVSNLEQPIEFNKHLREFLSGLDGVSIEFFSWND